MMSSYDPEAFAASMEVQLPVFVNDHREMIGALLDGLDESDARAALVPSRTTLLGLVKHATFVERVWFGEAVTGRSREELGIAAGPDESFELEPGDTIESVSAAYRAAARDSAAAVEGMTLDTVLLGNRRGPLPLRWVYLHVLRELAQHCGHGDILREQVLARRSGGMPG